MSTVQLIASPHHWRFHRDLSRKSFGRTIVEHPSANEFATYLSEIFSSNTVQINRPNALTEPRWTLDEVQHAVSKLKSNKAANGCGLVAELLRHAPPEFLMVMVDLFRIRAKEAICQYGLLALILSKLSKAFDRVHWPTLWRALRRSTRPSDGTIE